MDRNSQRFRIPFFRGRISFFFLIFSVLFSITLITSVSQLFLFNININKTVENWKIDRDDRIKLEALNFLLGQKNPEFNEPLEILDLDYNTIFSNVDSSTHPGWDYKKNKQGKKALITLYDNGLVIGYLRIDNMQFKNKIENLNLLNSLITNLFYSTIVSMILSFIVSMIVSKLMSNSTIKIKNALEEIESGKISSFIPSGAKEIREIGVGVKKLSDKLEIEKALRNQWLHDISHDLKTPLSALKLQFEGIIDGYLNLDIERIKKNNKEVLRLEHLIMGISELMKVESPGLKLNITNFKTINLIQNIEDRFTDLAELNSRKLSISYSVDTIEADYDLIFKAISNLVENAINYSNKDSLIYIDVYKNDKFEFVVSITNSGEDIPKSDLPHLFDRLYRGDSSRGSSGTGIGLSIVDVIVKKHYGTTDVTSENGVSCFTINWKL